ncbi:MAG: ABC transporter substrate-binding protein [Chitinophagaceae bacterium]|nr:ABC transporter substrate-binding protein [Oligoflexus sp.]
MKAIIRKCFPLLLAFTVSAPLLAQSDGTDSIVASGGGADCKRIYESTMQYYKALAHFLPSGFKYHDQLPTHQFLKLSGDGCELFDTVDLYQRVVSLHSQKIAIMLPFNRWPAVTHKALISHIKTYVASQGLDPEKNLVWLDTGGQIQTMQEQLAQLVFSQHISMVIGGATTAEAPVLSKWGDRLRIPTLILNKKFDPPRSRFVFRLGPDNKQMAASLVAYAEKRGFKKIAIIMPQSSRDGSFADALVGSKKIETIGPLVYNPSDYNSIDIIFKRLFHLNDDSRKPEMLDLVNQFKDKAKEEGVAFDQKGLMLPPEVDVDALVIIDNFKNVRHIAKSLHFYGVKHLPLLGIPKWRAPELVDQEEENLSGAVFVDYVGSYKNLPYNIKADTVNDENMIEGSEASRVDLELVVNHAVAAAVFALKGPKAPRFALYKRLEQVQPDDKAFFGAGPIFKPDHESNWPSFLFSVGGGKLQALQGSSSAAKPKSKPL